MTRSSSRAPLTKFEHDRADRRPVGDTPGAGRDRPSDRDCSPSDRIWPDSRLPAALPEVAVIVVGFRNAGDIVGCLRALGKMRAEPRFQVFIAENGGPAAMDALVEALTATDGPCRPAPDQGPAIHPAETVRAQVFRLVGSSAGYEMTVRVAEMVDNLGYAGAINAWLRPLLRLPGWSGYWILNPDTEPTPSALAELVAYAAASRKGMVAARITTPDAPDLVRTRGLAWHKLRARTTAVDYLTPAAIEPDPDDVETRLDAPSGSSIYVTRAMIGEIGLMDERYFLFFEDLEWGCRAKAVGGLGYAHRSVVPHKGGTTIGSAGGRANVSALSVYLEFRNCVVFVRSRHPAWLAWTVLMLAIHAAAFAVAGSSVNTIAALRGLVAGVRGEVGRPDRILQKHTS